MFLIDQPYVSDFLIQTLKDFSFPVIASQQAKTLLPKEGINWILENKAIEQLKSNPQSSFYTNSENAITWVEKNMSGSTRSQQIQLFKDKAAFRNLVKDIYPDFSYQIINLKDIADLKAENMRMPFVLKPNFGFFSLGVFIINNEEDLKEAQRELSSELSNEIYPTEVLSANSFIIEDYIKGEEYAIDSYYDEHGKVVLLNILHHRFSSGSDISDRVYSTSKEIILSLMHPIENFLQKIGDRMKLKNFPLHFEVRIDENNNIYPIEGNPMRFGGHCTTADLSGMGLNLNSYVYFMEKRKPNWKEIFKGKEDNLYSLIVLNNSSGYHIDDIASFNYDLLSKEFHRVINMRRLDIHQQTVFGFVFLETPKEMSGELDQILLSDLKKYISLK